jgi:DNA-binding GntR family transcriptional regulator
MMAGSAVTGLVPLRQESAPLRNQIIATLRSAIETGALQPGARLIERDLCEQLNVSRTSLREALRELQALGVLSSTENRGLVVGTVTPEEASNVYSIRAVLEALVVGQFVDLADDEALDQIALLGGALKKAYASGSVERILKAKRAFYDCICSGAQNALAFDIINRLTLRTSSLRSRSLARKERQQQSIKEIDAILAAVAARNIEAAKIAAAAHVENAAQSALAADIAPVIQPAPRRRAK